MKNYSSRAIAIYPQDPCIVYYGIYRTIDCGETWEKLLKGLNDGSGQEFLISMIKIDSYNYEVYLIQQNNVYKLSEERKEWNLTLSTSSQIDFFDVYNQRIYIGGAFLHKILFSNDGGITWDEIILPNVSAEGITYPIAFSIAVDFRVEPNYIYFLAGGFINNIEILYYRSLNGGGTFSKWINGRGYYIWVPPTEPYTIYSRDFIENSPDLIIVSRDAGETWDDVYIGHAFIVITYDNREMLFREAGEYSKETDSCIGWPYFEKSFDRGSTWEKIEAIGYKIRNLYFWQVNTDIIYAYAQKCDESAQ